MDWYGLVWTDMDCDGLGWIGMHRDGLGWIGMDRAGMGLRGMDRGIDWIWWIGMELNGRVGKWASQRVSASASGGLGDWAIGRLGD